MTLPHGLRRAVAHVASADLALRTSGGVTVILVVEDDSTCLVKTFASALAAREASP